MADLVLDKTTAVELAPPPDTSHLITEDDSPVDNMFSEKQQRLLADPPYSSWSGPGNERPFLVATNVGVFYQIDEPAIVPDVFLSLDVKMPEDWWKTEGRSYLIWAMGKPPDMAIEIVSNAKGGELTRKKTQYAQMRVAYYVVYDPDTCIQETPLIVYQLQGLEYVETDSLWFPSIGLGLTVWDGEFEGRTARWLRWIDGDGNLIPTGRERADDERKRANDEQARAERLEAQLCAAGIEPE
ncbi:Uma2 family endonuclease [Chloroflexi bacterium TSY]|nr:Uma2 family endonuclease [Chloroflexi bacterium TSY]